MNNRNNARWGIVRKKSAIVDGAADTAKSRYPLKAYTTFRKAFTRMQARTIKQSLRNPQDYMIVDLTNGEAVR